MTSTTFFIIFIPVLAFILLFVNLLLAPHNPYQEKDSVFECGFHSFLGQNRTQFSVSFFIFGLLFLLFDLEIVLIYPYSVSGYNNDIYGLVIMMVFFVLLTLGFIFELGKNALTIDSRQTITYSNKDAANSDIYLDFKKKKQLILVAPGSNENKLKSSFNFNLFSSAIYFWKAKKYINMLLALIVVAFWFLFISSLLGLNLFGGSIAVIFFIFITIHLRGLIGESNHITRVILILFIVVEGILLYYLVDISIPVNFHSKYSSLSYGIILFFYSSIAKMIFFTLYSKNNINYWSSLINLLTTLFTSLKRNPLSLLMKLLALLCIFLLINVVGNIIGLAISNVTFFLFILTLVCKISFFSWIVLIYRLPKIKNREEFYNIVGMSPYLPLSLIPLGYFYFTYLLPEIIMLYGKILPLVNTRIDNFIGWFSDLNFKDSVFNPIKQIGQLLARIPNRPGQLGKFLVCLANWALGYKIESVSLRPYPFTKYIPIIFWDPLAGVKEKIRGWNYVKSKPIISPLNISVPKNKLLWLNHFIYFKGSLSNIYHNICTNNSRVMEVFREAEHYKITNIRLNVSDYIIQFNFNDTYTSADIRISNPEGKPKNYIFDLMSYLDDSAKKYYMNNLVNKRNKDLQVYMCSGVFPARELPGTYSTLREELVQVQAQMDYSRDQLLSEFSVNVTDSAVQVYNRLANEVNRLHVLLGETNRAPLLTVSRVYGHFINIAAREAGLSAINADRLVQNVQVPSNVSLAAWNVLEEARAGAASANQYANTARNLASNISHNPMQSRTQALNANRAAYEASRSFNVSQLAVNRFQGLIRPYDPVRDV